LCTLTQTDDRHLLEHITPDNVKKQLYDTILHVVSNTSKNNNNSNNNDNNNNDDTERLKVTVAVQLDAV